MAYTSQVFPVHRSRTGRRSPSIRARLIWDLVAMTELQRKLLHQDYLKLCESGRAKELDLQVLTPDNHTIIWSFKISLNSQSSRWSSIEYEVEIIFKRFPFDPPVIKFPCSSINRKNPKHPLLDAEGILRCDFLNDLQWKPSVSSLQIVEFIGTIFAHEDEGQTALKATIEPSIMLLVLQFLPVVDILSVSRTSKAMFSVCNAEELWTYLLFQRSKLSNSFIYSTNFGPLRVYQSHGENEGKWVWKDSRETFIKAYEAHLYSAQYPKMQDFILNELPVITTMAYTSPFTGMNSIFSSNDINAEAQVSEEMKDRILRALRYRCRRMSRLGRWLFGTQGLQKQLESFNSEHVPVSTLMFLASISLQEDIRNEAFFSDLVLHYYASNETNKVDEQFHHLYTRRTQSITKLSERSFQYNTLLSRCYYEIAMMETQYQPPIGTMETLDHVNNDVIAATSISSTDQHPEAGRRHHATGNYDGATATSVDIYDFIEAYHESCVAMSQEFRDFRTNNIVDAMDCHGNWIAATIAGVHFTHPIGLGILRFLPNFVTEVSRNIVVNGIHQATVRSISNQSRHFNRGKASLLKRKLVMEYDHEINPQIFLPDMGLHDAHDEQQHEMDALNMLQNLDAVDVHEYLHFHDHHGHHNQHGHVPGAAPFYLLEDNNGNPEPHPLHHLIEMLGAPIFNAQQIQQLAMNAQLNHGIIHLNAQQIHQLAAVNGQPGGAIMNLQGAHGGGLLHHLMAQANGVLHFNQQQLQQFAAHHQAQQAALPVVVDGIPVNLLPPPVAQDPVHEVAPVGMQVQPDAVDPVHEVAFVDMQVQPDAVDPVQVVAPVGIQVQPDAVALAAITVNNTVPIPPIVAEIKLNRDNGLPIPFNCTKNMVPPMLHHNVFRVIHVYGNIHRGLYYEDRVQGILDAERRLDMLNEVKKASNRHFLDPNQVIIGKPGDVLGPAAARRCYFISSFPQSEFPFSERSNEDNSVECHPLPGGYRDPNDKWLLRVSVAVPDINDVLPITQPMITNPVGYVYAESSSCSKQLQGNARLSYINRRTGPYENFNLARAFCLHRAVTVHFIGFDDRFNEQLAVSSWRIAPFRAKSSRPISMAMITVNKLCESLVSKNSWSCNTSDAIEITVRCFWLLHRPGAGLVRMRAPRGIKIIEIINDYCNIMQLKNRKVLPTIITMETAARYMLCRRHGVPFVETTPPDQSYTWHGSYMNTPGVQYIDPKQTLRQAGIFHDDIIDMVIHDAKYDSI